MIHIDFLGDGLFGKLAGQFPHLLYDHGLVSFHDLETEVREEPHVGWRYFELGRRLLQDAKPLQARTAFLRALEIDSDDVLSRLGLACSLEAKGMTQTAMEELHRCLQCQPDFAPAAVGHAYCTEKLGDPHATVDAGHLLAHHS